MSKQNHMGNHPSEGDEQNEHLKSTAHTSRDEKSRAADERAEKTSGADHNLGKLRQDK